MLSDGGPANGYTIMQRLEEHVGAGWRASPGAIYPALLALADTAQVTARDDNGSRVYALTAAGRQALDIDREPQSLHPRTRSNHVTDDFARAAFREREARQIRRRRGFLVHASIWAAVNVMLVVIWVLVGGEHPWFLYPLLGWGIGLVAHGASAYLVTPTDDIVLEREEARFADRGTSATS